MLDVDLAKLYETPTKALLQAVKRNIDRFPEDFAFRLSLQEVRALRSQIVTSNEQPDENIDNSPTVDVGRGGRTYLPYVFTEQGVAMLSSVLSSPRAVKVNIEIMRAFVRLRRLIASHADLARKLEGLEKKYDAQFKVVFDAIRQLMIPPEPKKKGRLGFGGD
jgi:hypothetical protein